MNELQTMIPQVAPVAAVRPGLETALALAGVDPLQFDASLALAAEAAGCTVLFELPAALAGPETIRVAALAAGAADEFLWAALEPGGWRLLDGEDVGETMDHLTRSYAGVLGMLAESAVSLN